MSSDSPTLKSPFWPLIVLGLSLLAFFAWQLQEQNHRNATLSETLQQRMETAEKAEQIANVFSRLATDLINLSKEDEAAEVVVRRHGISIAAPKAAANPTP